MNDIADELLPCPFCGEKFGHYIMHLDKEHGGKYRSGWAVECRNCVAIMPGFNTKSEAITAWNTFAHISTKQEWEIRQEELETICAQAYQIVGSLLYDAGLFDTEKGIKILDNLSQAKLVHLDIIPWNI